MMKVSHEPVRLANLQPVVMGTGYSFACNALMSVKSFRQGAKIGGCSAMHAEGADDRRMCHSRPSSLGHFER
jgi:hypothetical protein